MNALLLGLAVIAAAPPEVKVETPVDGWSTERVVAVKADVGDAKRATIVVNGVSFATRVRDKKVSQRLVLSRGPNAIEVIADNDEGTGRGRVNLISEIPRIDLQVFLIFDPQPYYIDLWVTEPGGERCYWSHRETKAGGVLHDLYNDAPGGGVGLGPQTYTVGSAPAGEYLIQVNYWAGGDYGDAEDPVDGSVYGNSGQRVVPIRVEVVQYEGTQYERRQTFTAMLAKPSDTFTVGRIRIEPPSSRGDVPFDADRALMKGDAPKMKKKSFAGDD
jgi:uncharacterized protein YfaP (DUF2135 family)